MNDALTKPMVIFLALLTMVGSGGAGSNAPPAGPLGRPVLPSPKPSGQPSPRPDLGALAPGPPILTPPAPLPGPVADTVLVPGHWAGNRWEPGYLKKKQGHKTTWVPGHYAPDGRWIRGRWQ